MSYKIRLDCEHPIKVDYDLALCVTNLQHGDNPEAVFVYTDKKLRESPDDLLSEWEEWLRQVHEYAAHGT